MSCKLALSVPNFRRHLSSVFYFYKLPLGKTFICKVDRLKVKQRRSRWDGSLSRLIWIYAVCKRLLLSPAALKELSIVLGIDLLPLQHTFLHTKLFCSSSSLPGKNVAVCVCMCVCVCVRACVRVCVCLGGGGGGADSFLSEHFFHKRKLREPISQELPFSLSYENIFTSERITRRRSSRRNTKRKKKCQAERE